LGTSSCSSNLIFEIAPGILVYEMPCEMPCRRGRDCHGLMRQIRLCNMHNGISSPCPRTGACSTIAIQLGASFSAQPTYYVQDHTQPHMAHVLPGVQRGNLTLCASHVFFLSLLNSGCPLSHHLAAIEELILHQVDHLYTCYCVNSGWLRIVYCLHFQYGSSRSTVRKLLAFVS
jgi:hypothetical protein